MSGHSESNLPIASPDSFNICLGPSFVEGTPSEEEWLNFINHSEKSTIHSLGKLWFEKAQAVNSIPFRDNFSFAELVKFGSYLTINKLTDDDRWLVTFCGDAVVSMAGFEPTGKHLDEFGDKKTLKFWLDNLKLMTEESKPLFEYHTLDFVDKSYTRCEVLNLPLRSRNHDFNDMYFAYTSVI